MPALVPRYTIEELDAMPQEPGARYELVDGFLLVTPAPGQPHARLAWRLMLILGSALPEDVAGAGAPGEIRYGDSTSLQPDILVYPPRFPLGESWAEVTTWWLAIEVVSRSSRFYDREHKRRAYLALGVPECWVVDRATRTIEVWRTGDTEPRTVNDRLLWVAPTGHRVEIDLAALFRDIPAGSED